MGRFVSGAALFFCIISSCLFFGACGHSNPTNVIPPAVPASVSLTSSSAVSTNVSLEVGKTLVFTATARNSANTVIGETFSFQSSNTAVVTIAGNGTACAGTWDSLTNPQVCTPGVVGTAQVTATAQGVSSPPITIYVHQRITSIAVGAAPTEPHLIGPPPPVGCLSKGAPAGPESYIFQASAFNGSTDITTTVGPFSWQQINPGGGAIVTLSAPPVGSPLNREIVTASTPGLGMIFASASGLTSQALPVQTCAVKTISISAANNPSTSFIVNTGTSTTLNATVTDTLDMTLTGVPLTWNSSNPVSVSATGGTSSIYGSVGTASASAVGGAAVIASCTPPTCNGGIKPSLPIYPKSAISFEVHSNTAPASPTAYVTTTACATANPTNATCNATIVPITRSSSTSAFSAGTPLALPFSPNSLLYDVRGTNAFLGVDSGNFGQRGLMVFSGSGVSQATSVPGTPLAVSPDGTTAIISDTADSPNQVFICTNCGSSSRTVTSIVIPQGAAPATAAAFSPDNLKAYIVAGSTLYVYSKVDALRTNPSPALSAPANDVTFLPEGGFAYLAGGAPSAVTVRRTCDNVLDTAATLAAPATPSMIRALPDATTLLALEPPNIDLINVTALSAVGCTGAIADAINPVNLGQGSFTPTQFIIAPDGSAAYILGEVLQPVVSISAASQSGISTTYTYTPPASGPQLQIGQRVTIKGMTNAPDNGTFSISSLSSPCTAPGPCTFRVVNTLGVSASGQSGTATGIIRLNEVIVFNISNQSTSTISLAGGANPLSASLAPAGNLLFVGADDQTVHVIDTSTLADTQQVTMPFPTNEVCFGPGSPPTTVESLLSITAASQDTATDTTTYTYSLNSGPALLVGTNVRVSNMAPTGDNGAFSVSALGSGTFSVSNPSGVSAGGQTGTAVAGVICDPDLVVVKP